MALRNASLVLPKRIKPMLAKLTRHPFDSPSFIFELKWDGMRALTFIENGEVRIQSRNLNIVTEQFPEMAKLPSQVKTDNTVLDGELVCLDDEGKPSFRLLQQRLQASIRAKTIRRRPAVHFVAFDVLYADSESLMNRALSERKTVLHSILEASDLAQPCDFIENDGEAFFQSTCDMGLEGVMAKKKSSTYASGVRDSSWLKIKRIREGDFIICGYTFGGNRKELFSSLILGLYDNNERLLYVGQVGTGFSNSEAKSLLSQLEVLHDSICPFDSAPSIQRFIYWCRPELVCEVQYGEFTTNGKLRYPVFLSLRDDKFPDECRIDDAVGWPSVLL